MNFWKLFKSDLQELGLTEKEAIYVSNKICNSIRKTHDFCISDIRFDIDGKYAEEYNAIKNSGCCGFCDEEVVLKSGKIVRYGFCFGH